MIIATTWDRVDILKISKDVMTAVLGFEPPPPPLNPMSLSEPGLFEKMLQETGFVNIKQSTSTYPFDFGNDKTFQFKVGILSKRIQINLQCQILKLFDVSPHYSGCVLSKAILSTLGF